MRWPSVIGRILCLGGAILLLVAWRPGDGAVIKPGHEAYFAANVDEKASAACGWRLTGTQIQAREVRYRFTHSGGAHTTVGLSHPSSCAKPVKELFCVSASLDQGAMPGGRCGVDFLQAMVRSGVEKNRGRFSWFQAVELEKRQQQQVKAPHHTVVQFYFVSGLLIFLLVALVISLVRTRPWRTLSRPEVAALAVCLLLAAAARLALNPFPADVWLSTSQGLWLAGVHNWSAAYSAMLHLLFSVFPAGLDTAAAANVALSCATVVVVFAFTALYFDHRLAALASAAVFALQPISIRYAASDSPHVFNTLSMFLAVLFCTLWLRRGGYLLALQAVGWLAVCANTRVEALVCAGAVACVLAALSSRDSPARWRELLVSSLVGLAAMAYPLYEALSTVVMKPKIGAFSLLAAARGPFFHSPHSPLVVVSLAALGCVVVLAHSKFRRPGLFWIAAIFLVATPTIYITDPGWEHTHRHCLPSLAMFAPLAGLGLGWLLGPCLHRVTGDTLSAAARAWAGPALALVIVALAALPNLGFLTRTWSHQLEFEFLRANLGRVKDGCTVVGIRQPDAHVGLNLFSVLSHEVGRRHRWMELRVFLAASAPLPTCTVFIESASCHASHSRPARASDGMFVHCAAIMDRYVLQPVARTTIEALPYIGEVFTQDPVPLGIHKILGRKPRRHRHSD